MSILRLVRAFSAMCILCVSGTTATAQHSIPDRFSRILWYNAMPDYGSEVTTRHRQQMAEYLDQYDGGQLYDVTYTRNLRGGSLAEALRGAQYDILILDMANRRQRMNVADVQALQAVLSVRHQSLMLDGSFAIRNINHNPTTRFPGRNGSSAGILVNQIRR